jgi:CubicO group peptidase (beta-lactamase class C family)
LFDPLGMHDTGYLPLKSITRSRIAPTQQLLDRAAQKLHADLVDGGELRGVVHDPTVRFMGGVGGSAGVFTTAADLARYARMILNDGVAMNEDGSDGVRVLSRESVRLMREAQSPAGISELRSAGWDIHSPFSRPRGSVFPIGSFGHTGFTGCILWIDPGSRTFFVFLSNRVYPNDRGNILDLYGQLGTLSAQAVAGVEFSARVAK